ncbi:MAG: arginine--tRNA ligase [Oscillospiraceae bacterium]|jgi:arginyl-tRNA synthetase|nr:arginine--tRNA ligase [Oscillospiraceae bacterium]
MDIKSQLAQALVELIDNISGAKLFNAQDIAAMLEIPPDPAMGDAALPCFRFAKHLRKAPPVIAQTIAQGWTRSDLADARSISGYVNFFYNRAAFARGTLQKMIAEGERYGSGDEGAGKTICIDYSSINIAKRFHIGHLSTTMIGHSLKRIYDFLGYRTVGINHLGDWGTQFGKMISAYKRWGSREEVECGGVQALVDLYVRFHQEAKDNPELEEEGRRWFLRIEQGDSEAVDIFDWFKELTLRDVQNVYDLLGVTFDAYTGESFYNDKMEPIVQLLRDKGLLQESNGAWIVDLTDDNMPPCLILKSDGATLYATRDLAAAVYRADTYHFDQSLYVVAYQQDLHFRQLFRVLEKMGYPWAKNLTHVSFGMVGYEGSSLSTRSGHIVYLEDVLDRAIEKSLAILEEKSPELPDKPTVARMVGVGAVVHAFLSAGRIKDVDFWWDRVLNFDGETGPYAQYTHARCCSLLAKAKEAGIDTRGEALWNAEALTDDEAQAVLRVLERFPEAIRDAARKYEPSILTRYITQLAQAYNKYYYDHRILEGAELDQSARVELTDAVRQTLSTGLYLIGIESPVKM